MSTTMFKFRSSVSGITITDLNEVDVTNGEANEDIAAIRDSRLISVIDHDNVLLDKVALYENI